MWRINLNVSATPANRVKHPEFGKAGGAHVTCLISFVDEAGAVALARYYATQDKQWRLKKVVDIRRVLPGKALKGDRESLKFVREAKKMGYSLAFHIYPRRSRRAAERLATNRLD